MWLNLPMIVSLVSTAHMAGVKAVSRTPGVEWSKWGVQSDLQLVNVCAEGGV